jgi:two-component system, chemotaxis family, protein-glutamate methylesterase/glutaminase
MADFPKLADSRFPLRPVIRQGQRIRVLVVDDSVVIRRLVVHALEQDPVLQVVGTAADGAIALQRIPQLNPDVITLDIEMPVMDGMTALRHIREQYPNLCVIMFSTLTERGASATVDALLAGANDYVTKASNEGSLDRSLLRLRDELVPKIKQFFQVEAPATGNNSLHAATPRISRWQPSAATSGPRVRKIVAIGISTGGPSALGEIIPQFPENFSVPVMIVQHMPPVFTRLLAERLQAKSKLQVAEAVEGMPVEAGRVLVAAGNYHLRLARDHGKVHATLDQGPPENSCRPAVDALFRSVSEI